MTAAEPRLHPRPLQQEHRRRQPRRHQGRRRNDLLIRLTRRKNSCRSGVSSATSAAELLGVGLGDLDLDARIFRSLSRRSAASPTQKWRGWHGQRTLGQRNKPILGKWI